MKIILIVALIISNGLWLAAYFNAQTNAGMSVKNQPAQTPAGAGNRSQQQKAIPALPSSWAEIESEEYAIFIKNLRAFGCPDTTINHIVEGELRDLQEERKPLQALLTSPIRMTDPRRIQAEEKLREMDRINRQIVSQLLPGQSSSKNSTVDSGNNDQTKPGSMARQSTPVRMPLVLSGVAVQIGATSSAGGNVASPASANSVPGVLVATPEQAATIQKLQQDFIKSVGGPDQNPTDPDYLRKWQAAQPAIDQTYYLHYGQDAYYQFQKAAATKAYAEQQLNGTVR